MNRAAGPLVGILVVLLALAAGAGALPAQTIEGASQSVLRLNPSLNTGKPAYTIADCIGWESCLAPLVQEVGQAGGRVGQLAKTLGKASPDVAGEYYTYRYAPASGESFCRAVLLKFSVAPSFGDGAPEVVFSASRTEASVAVRLPRPGAASARVWFDGILILLAVADPDRAECTLRKAMRAECKGARCETIRF